MAKNPDDILQEGYSNPTVNNDAKKEGVDQQYLSDISKNYKNYFNTTIQNRILRSYSDKYMANAQRGSGYMNVGYAGTNAALMNNTEANVNANALSEYQSLNRQALSDLTARAQERDNQLYALMTENAGNKEAIDKVMNNYGYTYDDARGGWFDANGNKASDYITSQYDTAINGINTNKGSFSLSELGSQRFIKDGTAETGNYSKKSIAEKYKNAYNTLQTMDAQGKIDAGTVVKLDAYNGGDVVAYVMKNADGTWSIVDKDAYDKAETAKFIKGNKVRNRGE